MPKKEREKNAALNRKAIYTFYNLVGDYLKSTLTTAPVLPSEPWFQHYDARISPLLLPRFL